MAMETSSKVRIQPLSFMHRLNYHFLETEKKDVVLVLQPLDVEASAVNM